MKWGKYRSWGRHSTPVSSPTCIWSELQLPIVITLHRSVRIPVILSIVHSALLPYFRLCPSHSTCRTNIGTTIGLIVIFTPNSLFLYLTIPESSPDFTGSLESQDGNIASRLQGQAISCCDRRRSTVLFLERNSFCADLNIGLSHWPSSCRYRC